MSLQSEADAVLRNAVSNRDVPRVVATATTRDRTIYEGAFGERGLGGGIVMTADTVGWMASMTKALTGTAAMQLVGQGRLELDRSAADGAPSWAKPGCSTASMTPASRYCGRRGARSRCATS
jgi:methyl acetate hydrolase